MLREIILLSVFIVQVFSLSCPYECECPNEPTSCPAGVSLLTDGCNCCRICAKQEGQQCNENEAICDKHRQFFCDYSQTRNGDFGICAARSGKSCRQGDGLIMSGVMFEPTCKQRCWCIDGIVGCISLCPHETKMPKPESCPNARLVVSTAECCDKWVCDTHTGDAKALSLDTFWSEAVDHNETSSTPDELLPMLVERDDVAYYGGDIASYEPDEFEEQTAYIDRINDGFDPSVYDDSWSDTNNLPGEVNRARPVKKTKSNCKAQVSEYSQCSKSCGLGISTRISNMNSKCQLMREMRLCNLRPCIVKPLMPKHGKKCIRQKRAIRKQHIRYAGCRSLRAYKPRYCGLCKEKSRCCTPRLTRTVRIRLRCQRGRIIYRNMMVIRSCRCHKNCSNLPTNTFPFSPSQSSVSN